MRRSRILGAGLAALAAFLVLPALLVMTAESSSTQRYRVVVTNLTDGQPMSPPLLVTHRKATEVFEVGDAASAGVRAIAEDGDNSVLAGALLGAPGVHSIVATGTPIHRVGGGGNNSLVVEIDGDSKHNRLSVVTMLICTNDGFTGADSVKLPKNFKSVTYAGMAYDAGSEDNDELYTSIVDPCGAIGPVTVAGDGFNDHPATEGVIAAHPGIAGVGDLMAAHSWDNPVVYVTIQRIQ